MHMYLYNIVLLLSTIKSAVTLDSVKVNSTLSVFKSNTKKGLI